MRAVEEGEGEPRDVGMWIGGGSGGCRSSGAGGEVDWEGEEQRVECVDSCVRAQGLVFERGCVVCRSGT